MGVALCGRNLSSFHLAWAVAGGGVGVFLRLSVRGSLADLVMVTCTESCFPGVLGVELFDGDAGIFQSFLQCTMSCRVLESNRSTWHGTGGCFGVGESR